MNSSLSKDIISITEAYRNMYSQSGQADGAFFSQRNHRNAFDRAQDFENRLNANSRNVNMIKELHDRIITEVTPRIDAYENDSEPYPEMDYDMYYLLKQYMDVKMFTRNWSVEKDIRDTIETIVDHYMENYDAPANGVKLSQRRILITKLWHMLYGRNNDDYKTIYGRK